MILTGAGTVFSSGGNVKDMKRFTTDAVTPAEIGQWYRTGIQRLPLALQKLEVPSIAAVNGPAIGAGNDLACMCDMRIASTTASFAESFIRVGLIPGDGGAWLLPRVVGLSKAMEMSFTGDPVKADEALAIGLVSGWRLIADGRGPPWPRASPQPGADAAPDQAPAARRPESAAGFAARTVGRAAGDRAQDPGACRGGECLHRKARAGFSSRQIDQSSSGTASGRLDVI
jgi:enoyl-CoA hydratase/carnithine racemase